MIALIARIAERFGIRPKEAERFAKVHVGFSDRDNGYKTVAEVNDWDIAPNSKYLYFGLLLLGFSSIKWLMNH